MRRFRPAGACPALTSGWLPDRSSMSPLPPESFDAVGCHTSVDAGALTNRDVWGRNDHLTSAMRRHRRRAVTRRSRLTPEKRGAIERLSESRSHALKRVPALSRLLSDCLRHYPPRRRTDRRPRITNHSALVDPRWGSTSPLTDSPNRADKCPRSRPSSYRTTLQVRHEHRGTDWLVSDRYSHLTARAFSNPEMSLNEE